MSDLTPKKRHLPKKEIPINLAIFVISDSLSKMKDNWKFKDKSGAYIKEKCIELGFNVSELTVIPDSIENIKNSIEKVLENKTINLVITTGGTGISKADVTIEAIQPLLEKELVGFGELFRQKTYEEVGSVSFMTRVIAGVNDQTLICCLPGSTNAVKLGLKLLEPEIQHILNLRH